MNSDGRWCVPVLVQAVLVLLQEGLCFHRSLHPHLHQHPHPHGDHIHSTKDSLLTPHHRRHRHRVTGVCVTRALIRSSSSNNNNEVSPIFEIVMRRCV